MSCLVRMWVLGKELEPSARAVHASKQWNISPVLEYRFLSFMIPWIIFVSNVMSAFFSLILILIISSFIFGWFGYVSLHDFLKESSLHSQNLYFCYCCFYFIDFSPEFNYFLPYNILDILYCCPCIVFRSVVKLQFWDLSYYIM